MTCSFVSMLVSQGDLRLSYDILKHSKGFLHPIIHLGFGVEFKQPTIIAEALAQAAVHDNWIGIIEPPFLQKLLTLIKQGPYMREAEKAAAKMPKGKSMVSLLDEIRADTKLSTAAHWDDGNKIRDGIMSRAPEAMIHYGSQWKVTPGLLMEKTAEMTNAVGKSTIENFSLHWTLFRQFTVYFTGGAQHPPKQVKFDFYFIHCLNSTIFYHAFLDQPWISDENKARLLEWKGRLDLCMYASRRSPEPIMSEIINYKPKRPTEKWEDIFKRVRRLDEDGHCSKLVRALADGERLCEACDSGDDDLRFRIKGGMWLQLGHMGMLHFMPIPKASKHLS